LRGVGVMRRLYASFDGGWQGSVERSWPIACSQRYLSAQALLMSAMRPSIAVAAEADSGTIRKCLVRKSGVSLKDAGVLCRKNEGITSEAFCFCDRMEESGSFREVLASFEQQPAVVNEVRRERELSTQGTKSSRYHSAVLVTPSFSRLHTQTHPLQAARLANSSIAEHVEILFWHHLISHTSEIILHSAESRHTRIIATKAQVTRRPGYPGRWCTGQHRPIRIPQPWL